MGRPSPGFKVELLDPVTSRPGADEGEISLDLSAHPVGLMVGYHGDPGAPRRRWRAATTAPATSAPGTRTAT